MPDYMVIVRSATNPAAQVVMSRWYSVAGEAQGAAGELRRSFEGLPVEVVLAWSADTADEALRHLSDPDVQP
jgi:hypothetical protein